MTDRPWRVEYMNAESDWVVADTFSTLDNAEHALPRIEAENPGVTYRIRKHVDFEATT